MRKKVLISILIAVITIAGVYYLKNREPQPEDQTKISQECGVCGPKGLHNLEGNVCAPGLECVNRSGSTYTSVSYCVKPGESIEKCLSQNKEPQEPPYFSTPIKNSKVTSPLTVKGIVPAGWMFEGIVQVKLLDANRKVIAQAPGEEVVPGGWTDEEPDEFKSTLTFTTTAKTGYLVVGADNPSDLPENAKSYEIPVKF